MTEKTDLQPNNRLMDLVPLSRFNDYFDTISVGAIRQLVFYNTYGFKDKVLRLIGKRQYIKLSALQEWIEETNGGQVA